MKKTILPFLGLFCICLSAAAQFEKGQVLLGGNLSIGTNKTSPNLGNGNQTATRFSINPTIGFFKNDKTIYSIGLIYGHATDSYQTSTYGIQKNVGNNYGLNLSKQCFTPIAKNLYFTIAGTFTGLYQSSKTSFDQSAMYNTNKSGSFSIGAAPGISYKINNWLLCDLSLPNLVSMGYTTGTNHSFSGAGVDTKSTYNSFNLATYFNSNFFNNLAIGFRFMLNNKTK